MTEQQAQAGRGFQLILYLCQAVGVALVGLTLLWTLHYRGGFAWRSDIKLEFNWHVLLMTVGMVYLGGNANLIYRFMRDYGKKELKLTHTIMHALILPMVTIGLIAAFDGHNFNDPPRPNLYSFHSWIGLLTVILYCSQFLVGFFSFMYPGVAGSLRSFLMPYHVLSGFVIFIMSACAVLTGIRGKKYDDPTGEGFLPNIIGILVLVFTILVGYLLQESSYKRQSQPGNAVLLSDRGPEAAGSQMNVVPL